MGEIADSLLDGEFDYITGEYIGEGCGYPRTMDKQHKTYTFDSAEKAVKGVTKYLISKGKKLEQVNDLIIKYAVDNHRKEIKDVNKICVSIQKSFGTFVKWCNNGYK